MNKGKILLICLAGLFAASCAMDTVDQPVPPAHEVAIAKKFVNTSSGAVSGKLLLYVDKEYVSQLEAANGATYTGVSAIDEVAEQIGATGIHQLFNMKVNAEQKRELGMDRWFTIVFDDGVSVSDAAKALAATDVVRRVEFSKNVVGPNVDKAQVIDLSLLPKTRALAESYPDDESFVAGLQWPLFNAGNRVAPMGDVLDEKGNKTGEKYYTYEQYNDIIHPNAVAGADINVVPAWDLTKGSSEVIVAVLDQGIDFRHGDLAANMWVNNRPNKETGAVEIPDNGIDDDDNGYIDDIYGYNFAGNEDYKKYTEKNKDTLIYPAPILPQEHGTHVAGTVAAVSNNGIGIAGVAGGDFKKNIKGARLMSCQILGVDEPKCEGDAAALAMEYAADNGAVIAQNSWGNEPGAITSDYTYEIAMSARYKAFEYFMKKKNHPALDGGIIVFAAGNESAAMAGYPGAYNEYISVTALGPDGRPALYTNYGPGCNIAAPGGEYFINQFDHAMETGCVLSTLPQNENGEDQYGYMQGTSMATPHVSGVAALALSYAEQIGKQYTVNQFKELLLTSVADLNQRLGGYKYTAAGQEVALTTYRNKLGTGCIDAYRVLTAMHGMACVPVVAGKETVINVMDLVADGQTTIKILENIIIPDDVRKRLGIHNETIFGSNLILTCENTGAGVIKLGLVAGGNQVGGGNAMGGMYIEKEIAIIVRGNYDYDPDNNIVGSEGWL